MNFLCWNVRGLGCPHKRHDVKDVLLSNKCDVVALQESKLTNPSSLTLSSIGSTSLSGWSHLNSIGSAGGQLIGWKTDIFDCLGEFVTEYILSVKLQIRATGLSFAFSSVYGPSDSNNRKNLWLEMAAHANWSQLPWILMGDFNITRHFGERSGNELYVQDMVKFNDCIRSLTLVEPPLSGHSFTWCNNRHPPSLAKLDRILHSSDWEDSLPISSSVVLPSHLSDHLPILSTIGNPAPAHRHFRFEAVWLRDATFSPLVNSTWLSSPTTPNDSLFSFLSRLRSLRSSIKTWSKEHFGNILIQKSKLNANLDALLSIRDSRPLLMHEESSYHFISSQLDEILRREEILWRQRSRIQWLKAGDANTSFFHKVANIRRKRNHIGLILHNNLPITSPNLISATFTSYYKQLLGTNQALRLRLSWQSIYPPTTHLTIDIDSPFTEEEIHSAVFALGREKAPGPDGFSILFFQKYWDLIKSDIIPLFSDFFNHTLDLSRINYAWITLIPKKEGANLIKDFRPISLLNGIYKIIAKVLATRLSKAISDLIDPSQSAFLQGRYILDSVASANELISSCIRHRWPGLLIKIDFEKAFDYLDWDYLLDLLQARGFSTRWTRWISDCLHSATSSVLINSRPGGHIKCRRGLRQGDPLSPYLFILAVDTFPLILSKAVDQGYIHRVGNVPWHNSITSLQYADDTLLLSSSDPQSLHNLRAILSCYELLTGLRINFQKSQVFGLGMPPELISASADILGCQTGTFPFIYLGLPIKPSPLIKADWQPLLDIFDRRLASWKGASLSRGGRLILLNAVLSSLPVYFMSLYRIPEWVIHHIDRIRRSFFWKGKTEISGIHCLLSWDTIKLPKQAGGLGVRNIRQANTALLGRWAWNFLTDDTKAWKKLVCFNYYNNNLEAHPLHHRPGHISPFWKGVLKAIPAFLPFITMICGNGQQTRFWQDSWLTQTPLLTLLPNIASRSHNINCSVASLLNHSHSPPLCILNIHHWIPPSTVEELAILLSLLDSHTWQSNRDQSRWAPNPNKGFSSASFYKALLPRVQDFPPARIIWSTPTPLKIKIHSLLVVHNRLLTAERLSRFNIPPFHCVLCNLHPETADHLFVNCSFTREILWPTKSILLIPHWPADITALWGSWRSRRVPANSRKTWDSTIMATSWLVWKERNQRIFNNTSSSVHSIRHRVNYYS